MHVNEILEALGRPRTAHEAERLGRAVGEWVKRGIELSRLANQVYGLIEWGPIPIRCRSRAGVRDILRANGAPMHGDAILEALGEEPTTPNRCRLASLLNQHVLKGVEFTRPAPSTWGLIEWAKEPSLAPARGDQRQTRGRPKETARVVASSKSAKRRPKSKRRKTFLGRR